MVPCNFINAYEFHVNRQSRWTVLVITMSNNESEMTGMSASMFVSKECSNMVSVNVMK